MSVFARFEEARRLLEHAALLSADELRLVEGKYFSDVAAAYRLYAALVEDAAKRIVSQDTFDFPRPVTPEVGEYSARHITCTNNTEIWMWVGQFGIRRNCLAIPLDAPIERYLAAPKYRGREPVYAERERARNLALYALAAGEEYLGRL